MKLWNKFFVNSSISVVTALFLMSGCGGWGSSSSGIIPVEDSSVAFNITAIDDEVLGAKITVESRDAITLIFDTIETNSSGIVSFTNDQYNTIITAIEWNNILDSDYIIIKSQGGSDNLGEILGEMTAVIKVSDFKLKSDLIVSPVTTLLEKLITIDGTITDEEINNLLLNYGIADLNNDGKIDNKDLLLYNPITDESKLEDLAYSEDFLNTIREAYELTDKILDTTLFQLNTTVTWLDNISLNSITQDSLEVSFIVRTTNLEIVTLDTQLLSFTDNEDGTYTIIQNFSIDDFEIGINSKNLVIVNNNGVSANYNFTVEASYIDITAPVITLNGSSTLTLSVRDTYIELGATAIDDTDEIITVTTTGTVDTSTAGTYTISYSSIDEAGNEATASRIVSVRTNAPPAPRPPAPQIAPTMWDVLDDSVLKNEAVNIDVSTKVGLTNGDAITTYTLWGDALPAGLSFNASTWLLNGSTAVAWVHNFTITATDNDGESNLDNFSLTVTDLPEFTTLTETWLSPVNQGACYNLTADTNVDIMDTLTDASMSASNGWTITNVQRVDANTVSYNLCTPNNPSTSVTLTATTEDGDVSDNSANPLRFTWLNGAPTAIDGTKPWNNWASYTFSMNDFISDTDSVDWDLVITIVTEPTGTDGRVRGSTSVSWTNVTIDTNAWEGWSVYIDYKVTDPQGLVSEIKRISSIDVDWGL